MARSGNIKAVQKVSEINFSVELRPATYAQLEAGKRLFSKLVNRVQTNSIKTDIASVRSAPGGTAKPPPEPPSLTNRGA
jgi:hypothetical protein